MSFIQVGFPTDPGNNSYDEWINVNNNMPDGSYILRINGKSMGPAFSQGDILIVDPTLSARVGVYVVTKVAKCYENEATLKQYAVTGFDKNGKTFGLRPLNPLFPTLLSTSLELILVGVVAEKRTCLS